MIKATMVLEGGATRGVFTSGVLDYLMEKDFYTSYVIGGLCRELQRGGLCVETARKDKRLHDPEGQGI